MEEIFTGDRQLTAGNFPEELTPFPEPQSQLQSSTVDLFYPQPTPLIPSPTPQKLRPIRSNGRNPPEYSNQISQDEALVRINGYSSSELGFLPFQTNMGGNVGNLEEDVNSAEALIKLKSEMDAQLISNFKSQVSQLNFSLSSSSDGSGEGEEPSSSGKPRKKRRKNMELFLQDLMNQVIHKQEQMHQQLMDMFERKEKERIDREEAWRRQEMERAKEEQQIRAQEAARNLALISFIRNALGVPEIQVPELLPFPRSEENGSSECVPTPTEQDKFDPNNKRWPTSEVQALITLRAALDHKFSGFGSNSKAPVWEEVSADMAKMGYTRTAKKCKEKWDNLNKYYKRATSNGKKHAENAKSCPYFNELEALYKNRLITGAKPDSPTVEDSEPTT
ncbi:unnamed protein product [Amaranthus hypochondriacus]